ncbi:MAG TPA: hypothetical protein VGQ31_09885 [Candidatus Limnocylindrales bacterium]|jgi:hypothetical protein|nr:hypothetical protein [Candidatus Limnocylindrales bacterium]
MAHAGTPSDLGTRPAISAPSGHPGLWQAALVVVITAVVVMATAFIVASKATPGGPAADRSYDQIESLRGGTVAGATVDRSYDAIEQMRGAVPFVDPASDDIQTLRGTLRGGILVTGLTVDHRYDDVQSLKTNLR